MFNHNPEKILILGGSGFLGSALGRLYQHNAIQIQYLQHQRNLPQDLKPSHVFHGSLLSFDWNQLLHDPPQIIYHSARIPGSGRLGRVFAAYMSASANKRLLRWLGDQSRPPTLILLAGTLAYGSVPDREITEDDPLRPISFARQYHIGEQPILKAAELRKLPIQIMRPGWVYGHGSWFKSFYLQPMIEKKYVPLYGDGENLMSFIHVADAASMIDFIARQGPLGETFNLYCGPALKQKEFIAILHNITGLAINYLSLTELGNWDQAVAEAFQFSLRVGTKHRELYARYRYRFPDLKTGLKSVLENLI